MNANELADGIESCTTDPLHKQAATMLRQQQAEIEAFKNANCFIQNFAQEQHQRAVALEMRELTDEETLEICQRIGVDYGSWYIHEFAKAILRKAQEK